MAPKKDYTPEQMGKAIEAVDKGEKIATAAKQFGVPRITLYNKVSGKSPLDCTMGPNTILTKFEERILEEWLVAISKRHFPVRKEILMESVQKIVTEQGKPNPFTNNKPGKKWYQSFLKRHPDLTEKLAQNLTKSRDDVCEQDIRRWFDEITCYLEERGLKEILSDPKRVFNADETAFFLSPKAGRVLCKRGEKHLYNFCGDERENLTVLFTASAAGQLAPPMVVFKYERVPAYLSASVPDEWGIGKSDSGWMCGSTFYEFMANVFNPWLEKQDIQKPVLFFLDGHKSHLTLHLSNFCSANGIEVIALYPNSTHILQPMDLSVFRPLKVAWRKVVSSWQLDHLGQTLRKENFAPALQTAIASISEDCIKSGFRAGGLHPFGPDYIDMTKLKNTVIENEIDPKQTDFLRYLESEIVKVYSRGKLELFNKLYYKDRNTLEQTIPDEDESLYVIWAKNKQVSLGSKSATALGSTAAVPSTQNSDNIADVILVADENEDVCSQIIHDASSLDFENVSNNTEQNVGDDQQASTSKQSSCSNIGRCITDQTTQAVSSRIEKPVISVVEDESHEQQIVTSADYLEIEKNACVQLNNVHQPEFEKASCSSFRKSATGDDIEEPANINQAGSLNTKKNATYVDQDKNHEQQDIQSTEYISFLVNPQNTANNVDQEENHEQQNTPTNQGVLNQIETSECIPASLSDFEILPSCSTEETPQKHPLESALGVKIPTPFKKSLFWPEEVKEKTRRKKEKVPYAVTSQAWKEYHIRKDAEKHKQQEEKEKRAIERQKKKILKEQNIENKRKQKANLKKKKVNGDEDTTSDETDMEVTYAESDDSILNEQDDNIMEENLKRQTAAQSKRRKSCGSAQINRQPKRSRKDQRLNKKNIDSDDEPLSTLRVTPQSGPKIYIGKFVIVKYEGEYFPGKTENVDENQYEISTMVLSTGNSFRWPEKPDKIWYKEDDIVEVISDPVPLNKRGFFKIIEMQKYLPDLYNIK